MVDTRAGTFNYLPGPIRHELIEEIKPTVTGIISNELYDWAIAIIHKPISNPDVNDPYWPFHPDMAEHARWLIDRVHDGTLQLPPLEFVVK